MHNRHNHIDFWHSVAACFIHLATAADDDHFSEKFCPYADIGRILWSCMVPVRESKKVSNIRASSILSSGLVAD